jgi:hypothetical protein
LSACYSTINKLLAAENITDVKSAVKVAEWYVLAVDESSEISDTAQLLVLVRFFN